MVKKTFTLLIMIALCVSFCFAVESVSDSVGHTMIGYIYGSIFFDVSLNESVPFDLESPEVMENPTPATNMSGLRIGTYTLQTNTDFKLYIVHDKLHLVERTFGVTYIDSHGNEVEDPGTLSEIDYRLYLQTGPTGTFLSCKSDLNASISDYSNIDVAFQNKMVIQGRDIDLPNQGIYLSLEDPSSITDSETGQTITSTNVTVNQLKSGTYKSNIYFYLVVGT